MKHQALFFISFIIASVVFSQPGRFSVHLNNFDSLRRSLGGSKVLLIANDSLIQETVINNNGNFELRNIKPGIYSLRIKTIGFRDEIKDSVEVFPCSTTNLNLDFPFPCKYIYIKGKKPKCDLGHTDSIIPIVYGFPSKKMLSASKRGVIFLGGCMVSDCDPHYYCKKHHKEL